MRFLPLALTQVDERTACVGAVTADGAWVRPEPVAVADIADPHGSAFRYFSWTDADLRPSLDPVPRPEDRYLAGSPRIAESSMPEEERTAFLERLLDSSSDAVFSAGRTLGLIEAKVIDVRARTTRGGRAVLRMEFEEAAPGRRDWIVPCLPFARVVRTGSSDEDSESRIGRLVVTLQGARCFLAVALTRPSHRFPARYGGCLPLVVGVHSIPDYASLPHGAT